MYQEDSWSDLKDDARNTLHMSKLEYKTEHGKKANSFVSHVYPRDVKSAFCLVVNLFLEQTNFAGEVSVKHTVSNVVLLSCQVLIHFSP